GDARPPAPGALALRPLRHLARPLPLLRRRPGALPPDRPRRRRPLPRVARSPARLGRGPAPRRSAHLAPAPAASCRLRRRAPPRAPPTQGRAAAPPPARAGMRRRSTRSRCNGDNRRMVRRTTRWASTVTVLALAAACGARNDLGVAGHGGHGGGGAGASTSTV